MIRLFTLLIFGLYFLVNTTFVNASGFHINSIGNVQTGGRQLNRWWYSGQRPVIHGEATPGAEIIVDIDGEALSINADSAGNWAFQTETLTDGDHTVKVTSEGSSIEFGLTIGTGSVDWKAVESGNVETMPAAGTSWPTVLLLTFGLGLGIWGGRILPHAKN